MAGAPPPKAVLLGASMLCLQAAIGAVNDLVDAPDDARVKPAKPIPAGLVSVTAARRVAAVATGLGLGLAASLGIGVLLLAFVTLGLGFAYDLRLKRTTLAWLPFALALPVVPSYAWIGASGGLPPRFEWLLPVALLAGVALAIANGLADLEADRESGVRGLVARLGSSRSRLLLCVLQSVVLAGVWLSLALHGDRTAMLALAFLLAGSASLVAGTVLSLAPGRELRQRGWEGQALGCAALAVGWLLTIGPR